MGGDATVRPQWEELRTLRRRYAAVLSGRSCGERERERERVEREREGSGEGSCVGAQASSILCTPVSV